MLIKVKLSLNISRCLAFLAMRDIVTQKKISRLIKTGFFKIQVKWRQIRKLEEFNLKLQG